MAVTCAKCGEELLGAVNRCWKCGQVAVSTPDSAAAPPVRRSPVRLDVPSRPVVKQAASAEVITANVVDDKKRPAGDKAENAPATASEGPVADELFEEANRTRTNNGESDATASVVTDDARKTRFPALRTKMDWRTWLSVKSLVLGLAALCFGWLTPWMIIAAALGIACGVAGLTSRRKGLATFALLLCLLGVTLSSVRLAYDVYTFVRGQAVSPSAPLDPFAEDDPFDPLDSMEPLE